MNEFYAVGILDAKGGRIQGTFSLSEDPATERVILKLDFNNQSITKTADDYFEAMCEIRRELEKQQLLLSCYGASTNVYPSAMCRSMGLGIKAYRMRDGKHALMSDLVNIFDSGVDVVPATIDEQSRFFDAWIAQAKS